MLLHHRTPGTDNIVDLDLSSLSLMGSIPDSWTNLIALTRLAFTSNLLYGTLPAGFSGMVRVGGGRYAARSECHPTLTDMGGQEGCALKLRSVTLNPSSLELVLLWPYPVAHTQLGFPVGPVLN